MFTDLRFIIGIFFLFCGVTLLGAHIFGPSDLVEGVQMNLFSGGMMFAFGAFMTGLAYVQRER